jgi:hypothetical protein
MSYALDKKDPLKKNLINQDEKLQIFKEDAEQFIS